MSSSPPPDAGAGTAPATDRCPRCGAGFHCGMHDAEPCPCTDVRLDVASLQALRVRHLGCLCLRCLREIAAGAPV